MIICIFLVVLKAHAWIKFGSLFSIQPAEFIESCNGNTDNELFLTESDKAL